MLEGVSGKVIIRWKVLNLSPLITYVKCSFAFIRCFWTTVCCPNTDYFVKLTVTFYFFYYSFILFSRFGISIKKHKSKLTKLAELLLEKEVIFKEDLLAIFGPRPWDKEEIKEEKPKPKQRKAKSKKDEPKQVDNSGEDK